MNKPERKPSHKLKYSIWFFMAFKNLMHRKLRTWLTIIGVVIGIGAVFLLLSFGLGLQNLVTKDIVGSESIKTIDVTSSNSQIIILNEESIERFAEFPHVERVGRAFSFASSANFLESESDAVVYGFDDTFRSLSSLNLVAGSELSEQDVESLMINTSILDTVGITDYSEALGETMKLVIPSGGQNFEDLEFEMEIVGVIDSGSGSEVIVSHELFKRAGLTQYNQVKLVVDDRDNISIVRQQAESAGFNTASPVDTLDQVNLVFRFFNIVLVGFGSVGLIVAILGMFNTLTISLLERTQEVGLMMSHGARPRDIRNFFIIEAWLLSIIGAIIGVIGAVIFGGMVNLLLNQLASNRGANESFVIFSTPFWLVILTLIVSSLIGLVVVYLPARRAARISPIEALRN